MRKRVAEGYIAKRAERANLLRALKILRRAGVGTRPLKGDELQGARRKR